MRRFTFAPLNFVFIICGVGVIRNFSVTTRAAEKRTAVCVLLVLGNITRISLCIPVPGASGRVIWIGLCAVVLRKREIVSFNFVLSFVRSYYVVFGFVYNGLVGSP